MKESEIIEITKLKNMKRPELIKIAKDKGLQGYIQGYIYKAQLIELIKNPPSPPPPPPPLSDDELKEIMLMNLEQLRNKAKEIGIRRYSFLNKKELRDLIKNPTAPRVRKIKRKVTLISEAPPGDTFTFPSISQAAKYFKINPGILGTKFRAKSEKARNTVVINGILYKLEIE